MKAAPEPVSQTATPARQRSKPLLPVRAVISILDRNEDQVLRMVEEGQLAWAWDVRLDMERGRNKALRILPACVADYLRGQACSLEWPDVLRLLLPHDDAEILSKDITRVLNVCGSHTCHLAKRKLLGPCSTWRRGRGGCGRFTAKSFAEFLQSRRYP